MAESNHILRYSANRQGAELIMPNHNIIVNKPLTEQNTLQLLVWNIFKQKRNNWIKVLERHASSCQLMLLQEAHTTPSLINFAQRNYRVADQVPAFAFNDNYAGVMTLAKTFPTCAWAFKEREPFIRVPKSALVTVYPLANTPRTLMVANIHAVNFSLGLKIFQQQLRALLDQIHDHPGPVVLAGDFNTWSKQRMELLYHLTYAIHLKVVNFETDVRTTFLGRPLDFVFYRGLELQRSAIIPTVASDHNPLIATFSYSV